MPPTCPMIQLFGRGLGQAASTVNVGISAADAGRGGPSETANPASSEQTVANPATVRGKAADIGVMASSLFFLSSLRLRGLLQRVRVDQLEFLDALALDLAGIDVA